MTELASFLLTRLGEDEERARGDADDLRGPWLAWVLAECQTRRAVVEAARQVVAVVDNESVASAYAHVLELLALPYSGHPDYCGGDDESRPPQP